jgi:cytochrome c-type biogenesis protein CcmH/NrfG
MDVKEHWEKHKVKYAFAGGVLFAGITCIIVRRKISGMQSVTEPGMQSVTGKIFSLSFLAKSENTNVVSVLERESRGHPGYMVHHLETGDIYRNQGDAARALGAYPSIMSQHLRGLRPDVHGEHLQRVQPLVVD